MIRSSRAIVQRGIRCHQCRAPVATLSEGFLATRAEERSSQERMNHTASYAAQSSFPSSLLEPCALQRNVSRNIVPQQRSMSGCSQYFDNESEYHIVADETLEDIQDAVEMAVEDNDIGVDDEQPEVVYASGVLTMAFPPHGTWVLNKQTPNRQIWWSSPISGPRRYEYDPDSSEWIYTRSGENGGDETLSNAITEEFQEIYGIELDL